MKKIVYTVSMALVFACGQQGGNTPSENNQSLPSGKQEENHKTIEQKSSANNKPHTTGTLTRETAERKQNTPDNPFFHAYKEVHQALQNKNFKELNKFIDNNTGLYIIYSTGAMPKVAHIYSANQLNNEIIKIIESIAPETSPVTEEELPKIVCQTLPYNKQGVFGQAVNYYAENPVWEYSDINEKEKQATQFAAKNISYTIINTQDFVYCFGNIDGQVKLLFLDIRIPCSA